MITPPKSDPNRGFGGTAHATGSYSLRTGKRERCGRCGRCGASAGAGGERERCRRCGRGGRPVVGAGAGAGGCCRRVSHTLGFSRGERERERGGCGRGGRCGCGVVDVVSSSLGALTVNHTESGLQGLRCNATSWLAMRSWMNQSGGEAIAATRT